MGKKIFLISFVAILSIPQTALAYADPGIVGMFLQAGFAVLFGFFFAFVTKPWQKFKTFFKNLKNKNERE